MLEQKKIAFVSLGCDKNKFDLDRMIGAIVASPNFAIANEHEADAIVINTCAFLKSAREEAEGIILELNSLKKSQGTKIIISGCLPQLDLISKEVLDCVDLWIKMSEQKDIVKKIEALFGIKESKWNFVHSAITTPPHYAYLKIAEGCNNCCSYCLIPYIRGKYISRPLDEILKDAKILEKRGVKELILIAQDVSRWGTDLEKKQRLIDLLKKLEEMNFSWIRLMYMYPDGIDDELIEHIANSKKIVKYLDIPLQHTEDKVLQLMNRRMTKERILDLFKRLKQHNIAIRSTFIVGFAGETKTEFNDLIRFIKEQKLNNVGFFSYSKEPKTPAFNFKNQNNNIIKKLRRRTAYITQTAVAKRLAKKEKGKVYECILDEVITVKDGQYCLVLRNQNMAPEIDTKVLVMCDRMEDRGNFYKVKITGSVGIDLVGEIVN